MTDKIPAVLTTTNQIIPSSHSQYTIVFHKTNINNLKKSKIYIRSKINSFVSNKAKGRISKRVLRKQSPSNFPKNQHFLPLDKHKYVIMKVTVKMYCKVLLW